MIEGIIALLLAWVLGFLTQRWLMKNAQATRNTESGVVIVLDNGDVGIEKDLATYLESLEVSVRELFQNQRKALLKGEYTILGQKEKCLRISVFASIRTFHVTCDIFLQDGRCIASGFTEGEDRYQVLRETAIWVESVIGEDSDTKES